MPTRREASRSAAGRSRSGFSQPMATAITAAAASAGIQTADRHPRSGAHAAADLFRKRVPVERRRLRHVRVPREAPARGRLGHARAAGGAGLDVLARDRGSGPVHHLHQLVVPHVPAHRSPAFPPSDFFRFPRAWKRLAFTVPTVAPRMPATSSCVRSW